VVHVTKRQANGQTRKLGIIQMDSIGTGFDKKQGVANLLRFSKKNTFENPLKTKALAKMYG
jgi:hypothetical protein